MNGTECVSFPEEQVTDAGLSKQLQHSASQYFKKKQFKEEYNKSNKYIDAEIYLDGLRESW